VFKIFQNHRRLFWLATAAGIAIRLHFGLKIIGRLDGDNAVYTALARNLVLHHVYGLMHELVCVPTMIRMPGYPSFLAACFAIFGVDYYRPILLIQAAVDLGTCFLIADIARRLVGERAARWAYIAAAVCPFIATYAGCLLSECLEIFFTSLAIDLAIVAFDAYSSGSSGRSFRYWALCGASLAVTILLRPDGGLVLGSIGLVMVWQMFRTRQWKHHVAAGLVVTVVALSPLVPWAIRNYRIFHVVQPLVNPAALDPGEFEPFGFDAWVNTWIIDYSTTEDLTFRIDSDKFDMNAIPDRAFSDDAERQQVAWLAAEYNKNYEMTPTIDAKFGAIAARHVREHPLRVKLIYPAGRLLGMWFRPRTEMLPLDTHWWEFEDDPHDSTIAVLLAILNAIYMFTALAGLIKARRDLRFLGLLVVYPVVRSALLWHMSTVEDRYTLECFPMVIVLASAYLAQLRFGRRKAEAQPTSPAVN